MCTALNKQAGGMIDARLRHIYKWESGTHAVLTVFPPNFLSKF